MTKIIQRHDTAANWTSVNPVLAAGEMGVEYQEGTVTFALSDAVTTNGTPTFNNGLVSNFSTNSYYSMNTMLVEEMIIQFTTGSNITQGQYISTYPSLNIENGKLRLGLYSGFQQLMSVSASTQYTIKVINYSSKIEVYSGSTLIGTFNTSLSSGGPRFGSNTDGYPFLGTIDFRNTSINGASLTNKTEVFSGTSRFKFGDGVTAWTSLAYAAGEGSSVDAYTKAETDELLTGKQDKLTAVTPLKIGTRDYKELNVEEQITGGVMSDNYVYALTSSMSAVGTGLITKEKLPLPIADTWEVVIRTKLSADEALFYTSPYYDGFYVSPAGVFALSTNGTDYNYNIGLDASSITGQLVYMKCEYTGSKYIVSYSLDDQTYNQLAVANTSTKLSSEVYVRIAHFASKSAYYSGSIYLTDSYYKINGVKYPLAVIDEGALTISSSVATSTSLGVVQPDGTSITVSDTGIISGQDVKTFPGYSDTGTLALKSINGVLQWVAEA